MLNELKAPENGGGNFDSANGIIEPSGLEGKADGDGRVHLAIPSSHD
jgi:hypothetical protein